MRRFKSFTSLLDLTLVFFLLIIYCFDGVPWGPILICSMSILPTMLTLQIWSSIWVIFLPFLWALFFLVLFCCFLPWKGLWTGSFLSGKIKDSLLQNNESSAPANKQSFVERVKGASLSLFPPFSIQYDHRMNFYNRILFIILGMSLCSLTYKKLFYIHILHLIPLTHEEKWLHSTVRVSLYIWI